MPTFDVDWSPTEPDIPTGLYLLEVQDAEVKTSKKGAAYLNMKLLDAKSGRFVCYDILMLQGDARWSGQAKLSALGFSKHASPATVETLIGRRVWAYVTTREYNGQLQLCVDGKAKGSKAGFYPENERPEEPFYNQIPLTTNPTPKENDPDAPF
jgi:hypothetical protein